MIVIEYEKIEKKRRRERRPRRKKQNKKKKQTMAGVPAGREGKLPSSTRECRNAVMGGRGTGVLWTPSWDQPTTPSEKKKRDRDGMR